MIEPHALVSAVDANNATHVYLSVGGNDFLEGLPLGVDVHILYAEVRWHPILPPLAAHLRSHFAPTLAMFRR